MMCVFVCFTVKVDKATVSVWSKRPPEDGELGLYQYIYAFPENVIQYIVLSWAFTISETSENWAHNLREFHVFLLKASQSSFCECSGKQYPH